MGNSANSTYAGSSSTGSYFSSTRQVLLYICTFTIAILSFHFPFNQCSIHYNCLQGSTDTIEMNEDINSMPLVDLSKGLARYIFIVHQDPSIEKCTLAHGGQNSVLPHIMAC